VQIEADPLDIGRSYPNTTGLVGDPKATVARLVHLVGRPPRDHGFAEDAARIVAAWRASMAPLVAKETAPITVERLCAEVTRALPADGVLVADTGYAGIWTGTMIELNGAGQTYLRARPARSAGPFRRPSARNAPPVTARCSVLPAMVASTITSPNWSRRAAATSRS
jgi:thiamine pyrophosphate-dependent acetolactate synthase large subunit-like protein